jgi:hypothetical protein
MPQVSMAFDWEKDYVNHFKLDYFLADVYLLLDWERILHLYQGITSLHLQCCY